MAKIFLSFQIFLSQIFQQRLKIFLNFVLCDAVAPIWRDPLPNLTTRDLNSERNVKKSEIFPLQYNPKNIILSKNFLQLAQPHEERSQFREKYENNRNLCIEILSKKIKQQRMWRKKIVGSQFREGNVKIIHFHIFAQIQQNRQ